MSKTEYKLVFVCAVVSGLISLLVCMLFAKSRTVAPSDIVRAKKLEILGSNGQVLGTFGVSHGDPRGDVPRLSLLDRDGRESIVIGLNGRGDGDIEFANDRWIEGAVILGHLQTVDYGTESKDRHVADGTGAWGLRIRSSQNEFTGVGFLNSGQAMVPLQASKAHP